MGNLWKSNWKIAAGKSPTSADENGEILTYPSTGGAGDLSASGFVTQDGIAQSGFAVGPSSATDNSIAWFNGTTGKLIDSESDKIVYDGAVINVNDNLYIASNQTLHVTAGRLLLSQEVANSDGFTTSLTSYFVGIASPATSGNIYATPTAGQMLVVKDVSGTAGGAAITISGNGKLIDGSSTATISTNYGSLSMIYSNGAWSII